MATKSHKTLTGNQLHEPKGADAASANTLYVADGAGSGAWSKLTASNLTTTGNPFGGQLLHVRNEQTSGTADATLSTGWNVRGLNTVKTNEITGASLASNQVTLPAGTYRAWGVAVAAGSASARTKIYNRTNSVDVIYGVNTSGGLSSDYVQAQVTGTFILSGTVALELWTYVSASTTVGAMSVSSLPEVYSELLIWKIA